MTADMLIVNYYRLRHDMTDPAAGWRRSSPSSASTPDKQKVSKGIEL